MATGIEDRLKEKRLKDCLDYVQKLITETNNSLNELKEKTINNIKNLEGNDSDIYALVILVNRYQCDFQYLRDQKDKYRSLENILLYILYGTQQE